MTRLAEKIAIVTGGAGGIGLATSTLFAKEGAKVLLVDLDEQALREAVVSIGSDAVSYVVADVTQPEQVQKYIQAAVDRYGGIDISINNAGVEGEVKPITDYSVEMFDKVMAVNVRGVWLGLKYVIPEMQKRGGGSIVITSSTGGVGGHSGLSAYNASKHAVIGIMRSVTAECGELGIRINTVNPGGTETRMIRSLERQMQPDNPDAARENAQKNNPLQRYATPEEVAQMMLFLSSDESSSYCTGGVYMVDGGGTKRR
ncbi:SDR family oxidoreductase [Chloroflexi bacterium TSY]|nr:SDR family oxidoreductase [Chloroflexi bacterium TSY]